MTDTNTYAMRIVAGASTALAESPLGRSLEMSLYDRVFVFDRPHGAHVA